MADLSRTPFLGRYLRILVLTTVALTVLSMVLTRWNLVAVPAGALAILPPAIASYLAGRAWGQAEGVGPSGRAAWIWSILAALAYLAVQVLLLPLAFLGGPFGREMLLPGVGILAMASLAAILVHRVFVALGARHGAAG